MNNREIKFRAWDKNREEYRTHFDGWSEEVDCLEEVFVCIRDFGYVLEQFTGLHDKNGTPVYEGDIVRLDASTEHPYLVYWDDGFAGWSIRREIGEHHTEQMIGRHPTALSCEVVGNIHEMKSDD